MGFVSLHNMKLARSFLVLSFLLVGVLSAFAQPTKLEEAQQQLDSLAQLVEEASKLVQAYRLESVVSELKSHGIPHSGMEGEIVSHSAMILEYDEESELAAWVYHMILPDIKEGQFGRSNDFRIDPKISTGSAEQEDYFLVSHGEDGETVYDGFGYDRGHLAPSADFRWSEQALSESYYYSNMAPQLPQFNRDDWVSLENELRKYVIDNNQALMVVSGSVLKDELKVQERSKNGLRIPNYFYKVAYNPESGESVGFIYPHREFIKTPDYYAVTVDSVEAFTGIDFFAGNEVATESEKTLDKSHWFPDLKETLEPLDPLNLPKNTFNSVQARYQVNSGRKVNICGQVVEAYHSRNGHAFITFDRAYPEPNFRVFVSAEFLINFDHDPVEKYKDKCLCVTGKVAKLGDTPTMFLESGNAFRSCDILK